ncbi:MAG TPA: PH domain-containing protein [Chloroflexota bacterium]|nr:PH domain-containing protein [Chloroflexota bacterium]
MQAAPPPAETQIWEGSPSQWLNFKTYFICWVGFLAILAGGVALWDPINREHQAFRPYVLAVLAVLVLILAVIAFKKYLDLRCTRYLATTERLRITRGIFSRRTDDTELYRVDDTLLEQPFLLRLVGRGNVVLVTSDRSTPNIVLRAIPKAGALRDNMRPHVEACRDRKRTRVIDFDQ